MSDKGTILIVDDTHESLKLLADLLTAEGYQVRPADSGKLALASVSANLPALILLDIRMPGMDGFEVFRQIKAHKESRNIPIIFISALTDLEQRVDGLKLGAVDFISKPFQREELLARVQTHMELSQLHAHLEQMVAERTFDLRKAQEKLIRQEKLAVIGQMAGSVGHELRNPLGIIMNAVYFLKMAQPDASLQIKEYLDIIETETRNSDKIIGDLLDFSRVKSVNVEPVIVADLIRHTFERFPTPETVHVMLNLPETSPIIFVDPRQITQVLGNLVVNACQAMLEDGELTVSATSQDGYVMVAIKDSGSGISIENMSKLFEPLFTTKSTGIGLGLAVSKKLVEANGGRIEVISQAGNGSTFTVFLPQERREK